MHTAECEVPYTPSSASRSKFVHVRNRDLAQLKEKGHAWFRQHIESIAVVALLSALMCEQTVACPRDYFQCGSVCCPSR